VKGAGASAVVPPVGPGEEKLARGPERADRHQDTRDEGERAILLAEDFDPKCVRGHHPLCVILGAGIT
jgi:hypothetical protein